ncbi:T9SS type A sorting domain-containing protein [Parvicella tangerina]|nr:T9SS type A sorting domain-containing protein [Parvicella tangerina]
MKPILLISALVLMTNAKAQTTLIPDVNFEQRLIQLNLDSPPIDGMIFTDSIINVTQLDLANFNISDLTGLEDFQSLEHLYCHGNLISNINVSNNIGLKSLTCTNNYLSSLDISNNPELNFLDCGVNQITEIDVSNNPQLWILYCYQNDLLELDLSNNDSLEKLRCHDNINLNCLNIKNTNLTVLNTSSTSIQCIEVSDIQNIPDTTSNDIFIDGAIFSENCGNSCSTSNILETDRINFSVFPNPLDDAVNISFPDGVQNGKLSLFNIQGMLITQQNFFCQDFIKLTLNLPKGVYFLQLDLEQGYSMSYKIMKK